MLEYRTFPKIVILLNHRGVGRNVMSNKTFFIMRNALMANKMGSNTNSFEMLSYSPMALFMNKMED